MQYNSWLYLFPFLGGSIILYYLIPVKRRWIGLLFSSLLFYILAMKNLVARCFIYDGNHLSWRKNN